MARKACKLGVLEDQCYFSNSTSPLILYSCCQEIRWGCVDRYVND